MPLPIEKQLFEVIQKHDEELVRTVLAKIKRCNEELEQIQSLKEIIKQPASIEVKDENGCTPLIHAVKEGHVGIVKALLENGARVDNPAEYGNTPIMSAAQKGKKDCLKLLIEANANLNAKGQWDRTPLMWAAVKGELDCLQIFLEHKVELNNRDVDGCTALILATKHGFLGPVSALLLAGADPTIKDNNEKTAGQHALRENYLECYDMLTDSDYFKSPEQKLFTAIRLNDIPLLKETITQIKKMNDVLKEHPSMADMMDHPIPSIDAKIRNSTPLILAAQLNNIECLTLLIDNKADLNINLDGTALVWAAFKKHYDCIKLLLNNSDRVDLNAKDNECRTPLMFTALKGCEKGIKVLLEQKGIDVNAKDKNGYTALMYAVPNGEESCIQLLAEADAIDLNAKNKVGATALMLAATHGKESGIKTLLEQKGIDVNAKDNEGHTALIYAVENDRESCAKLLMEQKGIDLDAQAEMGGYTALHNAARNGNAKLCELLIAHGANTQLRSSTHRIAAEFGCTKVIISAIKKYKALHPPYIEVSEPEILPIEHSIIVDSKPETGWSLNSIWIFFKSKKQSYAPLSTSDREDLSAMEISSPTSGRGS